MKSLLACLASCFEVSQFRRIFYPCYCGLCRFSFIGRVPNHFLSIRNLEEESIWIFGLIFFCPQNMVRSCRGNKMPIYPDIPVASDSNCKFMCWDPWDPSLVHGCSSAHHQQSIKKFHFFQKYYCKTHSLLRSLYISNIIIWSINYYNFLSRV